MFIGVGGAIVSNIVGICRVLPIMSMFRGYPLGPSAVVLWCIHSTRMSRLSVRGSIRSSSGIVGSSYIMVSALKCVMTCEYGKGPSWGLVLWYQLGSIVISIVIVSGIFLAASLAQ